ncbi:MAG: hypothetical protein PHW76_06835 [Alphaproteobacteria bacterium]|nr:hypothetical protein [Alphaproteobacteria bacterium]
MIRSYSSLLFWLGMAIASSVMLYHTSDRVTVLDRELNRLNADIEREQETLHVLKAEWVYLSNPARIEAEAKRHLGIQETSTARIATLDTMSRLIPMKDGSQPPVKTAQASLADTDQVFQAEEKPRAKRESALAGLNAGRINERMTMQHSKAAVAQTDQIGVLIGKLGLRP